MIIRNHNKRQFTMVDTKLVRSRLLRPDELGLYTLMLSHTDNWNFNEKVLSRETDAAYDEIRDILYRLEEKGFAVQRVDRFGVVWDLIEDPSQGRYATNSSDRMRRTYGETARAHVQNPSPTCMGPGQEMTTDTEKTPKKDPDAERRRWERSEREAEERGDGIWLIRTGDMALPEGDPAKTQDQIPSTSAESPQMTHEQMATNFFALAEKLKKEAAARKLKS